MRVVADVSGGPNGVCGRDTLTPTLSRRSCASGSARISSAPVNTIYGALLVVFIVFMPRGIVGLVESRIPRRRDGAVVTPAE